MEEAHYNIYGNHLEKMKEIMNRLQECISKGAALLEAKTGMNPAEHIKSRIKADESMREKCRKLALPETTETALFVIHDAIGLRVVCSFLDDVYALRDYIAMQHTLEVIEEKDYIRHVKPNGYRSYHMIVKTEGYYAEIQLRTISMDTWAALEHHLRYKKTISGNTALIFEELKRCADELASTDVTMQTIRNMINGEL